MSGFLHLSWQDIHVTFQEADTRNAALEDGAAAQLLQQEAALQAADGNLEEELFLFSVQQLGRFHQACGGS